MTTSGNERIAKKILNLINDLSVDEEYIGVYLARISSNHLFTRFQLVANSAILERNQMLDIDSIPDLDDDDFVQQNGGRK